MLLLLLLCLAIAGSTQNPDHSGIITVPAEGSISLPCGDFSTSPVPLVLKLQMEDYNNDSWVLVGMTPIILALDTSDPSLLLTLNGKNNTSDKYSCSVDNSAGVTATRQHADKEMNNMSGFKAGETEWITCRAPKNWTLLQWSRGGDVIAIIHKGESRLNVLVERKASSFSINSTITEDAGNLSCPDQPETKILNITCQWSNPLGNAEKTGWQRFVEEKYWIIVAVASAGALFCLLLTSCFVNLRRRRRVRKQARSRFFKMSAAARNLYTDSLNQGTDVAHKDQDFTYQNVSAPPTKPVSADCYSDKSSFLSEGGDSYLEPTPEGGDQVSDAGGCYENPSDDLDGHEDSIDGDCYENNNEEIKDGSEGSQSYEDMEGSICIRTKPETSPDEGITQDEDADSYENMQTPLYSQPNRVFNPTHKSTEDQAEGRKASLVDPTTHQHPWKVSTELQEQNGDFYLSYETNKL